MGGTVEGGGLVPNPLTVQDDQMRCSLSRMMCTGQSSVGRGPAGNLNLDSFRSLTVTRGLAENKALSQERTSASYMLFLTLT
jgi:hypothetical protein